MSEMIERVARALYKHAGGTGDLYSTFDDETREEEVIYWEDFVPEARAAIEAVADGIDGWAANAHKGAQRVGIPSVEASIFGDVADRLRASLTPSPAIPADTPKQSQ
jgi:hypothetical protein